MGKKILRFLFSMRFAIILLLLMIAACVAGSLIKQGNVADYYRAMWPGLGGELILAMRLDDVFHSTWFGVLTAVLCLNLLGCNVIHGPALLKAWKGFTAEKALNNWDGSGSFRLPKDPAEVFDGLRFHGAKTILSPEGRERRYAVRGKAGVFGAWLTHLGLLVIIAGYAMGQIFTQTYSVYGVPGQTKPIADTGYSLTIDSFDIALREDDTVDQYTAELTVTEDATGRAFSGKSSVNHPLSLFGMKLFQNSTGFAAYVEVYRDGELRQREPVCVGEMLEVKDEPGLVVLFPAFYPDLIVTAQGMPATAETSSIKTPGYLYALYYGETQVGMNVLKADEYIKVDHFIIRFTDPQHYTLIQIKKDPFTYVALAGGLLLMAALFLAFYCRTAELMAEKQGDGTWILEGRSRKGGLLFQDEVRQKVLENGGVETDGQENSGEEGGAQGEGTVETEECSDGKETT